MSPSLTRKLLRATESGRAIQVSNQVCECTSKRTASLTLVDLDLALVDILR